MPATKQNETPAIAEVTEDLTDITDEVTEVTDEVTETPDETETTEVTDEVFAPYAKSIADAALLVKKAEKATSSSRLKLGRVVNTTVSILTAQRYSAKSVQAHILQVVSDVLGDDRDWKTIADWSRAAILSEVLPVRADVIVEGIEDLVEVKVRDSFNVGGHLELGRIPEDERPDFAVGLVQKGITGDGRVRAAVDEHLGIDRDAKRESGRAASADKILKKVSKIAETVRKDLSSSLEWSQDLQDLVIRVGDLGVRIGRDGAVATQSQKLATETALYFGPVRAEEGTDEQ